MRSSKLWVFLAVTLASISAGVAVAGIPSRNSVDLSDVTSVPLSVPTDATTSPSVEPVAPATSIAPPSSDSIPDSTSVPAAPSTSTTSSTAPVAASNEVTPTTRPPIDRSVLSIVVANGAARAGVAGDTAVLLGDSGYLNVRTLDGAVTVEITAVYAAPGFEAEGEQLAIDLGLDPTVFPLSAAPEVPGLLDEPLLVYLGTDVATP